MILPSFHLVCKLGDALSKSGVTEALVTFARSLDYYSPEQPVKSTRYFGQKYL